VSSPPKTHTWETINARERQSASNSYFHLPEILAWRSAEISSTANLAQNLYVSANSYLTPERLSLLIRSHPEVSGLFGQAVPHFIFAIKHPAQTLYQLLFRRDLLLTYASYPITNTRNDLQGRTEIDNYRQRLFDCAFLTILDPLTIDELRFKPPEEYSQDSLLRPRWQLSFGPPMAGEVDAISNPFEGYNVLQPGSFRESVARHIEARDYHMVSQANCVAAYRPFYGGPLGSGKPPASSPSGGVDKELFYALVESKLIYAVHPPEDRRAGTSLNFHAKT